MNGLQIGGVARGLGRWAAWSVLCVVAVACNNPGATTSTPLGAPSAGGSASPSTDDPSAPALSSQFGFDRSWLSPVNPEVGGEGGAGGASSANGGSGSLHSPSTRCGDAIVGADEECDDGDDGLDGCTSECQTRDQLVVPATEPALPSRPSRVLGRGRHPIAGGDFGFITVYSETGGDEPSVGATVFNELGQPALRGTISAGSLAVTDANPVAAALPSGEYAVAWTDFGGDGSELGVALRKVNASGELGALRAANGRTEFSQSDPDLLWAGDELVVAWVDSTDPDHGPDIRYRTFDADLVPRGPDLTLAASAAREADVALATFGSGWAAAYREGTDDGFEYVVVKSGEQGWRLGPLLGGFEGERPALVELDQRHLLVAFTDETDPQLLGAPNTPRVRYAVIDTEGSAEPEILSLRGTDSYSSQELLVAQSSPALERGPGGVFLAWRTGALSGDAAGEQLWIKSLGWAAPGPGAGPVLAEHDPELLLPRLCESSTGDQRTPALARTTLYPQGALAIAWDDYSHSLDAHSGSPDVVVHYAPNHPISPAAPEVVTESWDGKTRDPWPAAWAGEYDATKTGMRIYDGVGHVYSLSGAATALAMLVESSALNADVVVTVRMTLTNAAVGIVLRRSVEDPSSYFLAKLSSIQSDLWRIQVVNDGVVSDVATLPQPKNFYAFTGNNASYRLRFRAVTAADGSVFLGMKGWAIAAAEPASWQLSATLLASSPLVTQLASRPGQIGLFAQAAWTGRDQLYDDFRARYFRGLGDLDQAPDETRLPLKRSAALYRVCSPGSPCVDSGSCCTGDSDCGPGRSCLSNQGQFVGVGSHASVCSPSHCGNSTHDADETWADAGGNDCAPRECTPTVPSGEHGYCTQTCPCGVGQGDCIFDAHCLPGLTCGRHTAELYGGPVQYDACVPLHCLNRVQDADETLPDCGGSCGSNCACSPDNGGHWHCRVYCPCAAGHGDCDLDDECAPGLLCALNRGTRVGIGALMGVCLPPHCLNGVKDAAETSVDCGDGCGCGGCAVGCVD